MSYYDILDLGIKCQINVSYISIVTWNLSTFVIFLFYVQDVAFTLVVNIALAVTMPSNNKIDYVIATASEYSIEYDR